MLTHPCLMLLILGWYIFCQLPLPSWLQLIGPRLSISLKGDYLFIDQCTGRAPRTKAQLRGAIPSQMRTAQSPSDAKHTERKTEAKEAEKLTLKAKQYTAAMNKPDLWGREQSESAIPDSKSLGRNRWNAGTRNASQGRQQWEISHVISRTTIHIPNTMSGVLWVQQCGD